MSHIVKVEEIEIDGVVYIVETYSNGSVVKCRKSEQQEPEPTEPQPDIEAELLLNQMDIIAKQNEQDEVLAEILLNQIGG